MIKAMIIDDEWYTLQDIKEMAEATGFIEVCGIYENPLEAFDINALDYIMKPISTQRFSKMADRLKKTIDLPNDKEVQLNIQCFGNFEVKIDEVLVKWQRAKAIAIIQTSVCKIRNVFSKFKEKVKLEYSGGCYYLSISSCNCEE